MIRSVLFLLFFIASTSQAQAGLKWEVDTIAMYQAGCRAHSDSLYVIFTNVSAEDQLLIYIDVSAGSKLLVAVSLV